MSSRTSLPHPDDDDSHAHTNGTWPAGHHCHIQMMMSLMLIPMAHVQQDITATSR